MLVTLLGMVMEVRPEQSLKAANSMFFTLLGMIMDVKPLQPLKEFCPISVTLLGITVFWQPAIKVLVAVSMIASLIREIKETKDTGLNNAETEQSVSIEKAPKE